MKLYITDIDRTTPIGKVLGDYGDYQWNNGFLVGCFSGFCICSIYTVIIYKKIYSRI